MLGGWHRGERLPPDRCSPTRRGGQILAVAELLGGTRIDMPPPSQVNVTFKRAPQATREAEAAQQALFGGPGAAEG